MSPYTTRLVGRVKISSRALEKKKSRCFTTTSKNPLITFSKRENYNSLSSLSASSSSPKDVYSRKEREREKKRKLFRVSDFCVEKKRKNILTRALLNVVTDVRTNGYAVMPDVLTDGPTAPTAEVRVNSPVQSVRTDPARAASARADPATAAAVNLTTTRWVWRRSSWHWSRFSWSWKTLLVLWSKPSDKMAICWRDWNHKQKKSLWSSCDVFTVFSIFLHTNL